MKQKRIVFIIIGLVLIFVLLAWSPWVNERFVESRINYHVYFFEKIPFGARSILYYIRDGRVDGIREKVYSLEYTSFLGTREVIYDDDLEKIKPKIEVILESEIINAIKEKFPDVKDINKPEKVGIGTSQNIYGELIGTDYIITFWKGEGDCPAGCIWNHWWYFEVTSSGEINKIGERGNPIAEGTP